MSLTPEQIENRRRAKTPCLGCMRGRDPVLCDDGVWRHLDGWLPSRCSVRSPEETKDR